MSEDLLHTLDELDCQMIDINSVADKELMETLCCQIAWLEENTKSKKSTFSKGLTALSTFQNCVSTSLTIYNTALILKSMTYVALSMM